MRSRPYSYILPPLIQEKQHSKESSHREINSHSGYLSYHNLSRVTLQTSLEGYSILSKSPTTHHNSRLPRPIPSDAQARHHKPINPSGQTGETPSRPGTSAFK